MKSNPAAACFSMVSKDILYFHFHHTAVFLNGVYTGLINHGAPHGDFGEFQTLRTHSVNISASTQIHEAVAPPPPGRFGLRFHFHIFAVSEVPNKALTFTLIPQFRNTRNSRFMLLRGILIGRWPPAL